MALRPVSELGLVDLTDLASPEKSAPARRKPSAATGGKPSRPAAGGKPSRPAAGAKPSRRSAGAKPPAKGSAQPERSARSAQKASPPAAPARSRRARVTVGRASRIGVIAATWAAAGTGGILLGRAAVRR